MIKVLETAIAKVKTLPDDRQAYAAHVLEQIAGGAPFQIPADHLAAVQEGLAQAKAGVLVSDEDVAAVLLRPWA